MIGRRCFLASLLLWQSAGAAFVVPTVGQVTKNRALAASADGKSDIATRRELMENMAAASLGMAGLLSVPQTAAASGGATAGGVYLLSAKQRYNQRVESGVKAFIGLGPSLEGGSVAEAKVFFEGDSEGTWKDFAAAGYLLANAFRTSSGTPPDRLPSVKKWKAFQAEVDAMQKAIKGKSKGGAKAAYGQAMDLLDPYLDSVELPPAIELK